MDNVGHVSSVGLAVAGIALLVGIVVKLVDKFGCPFLWRLVTPDSSNPKPKAVQPLSKTSKKKRKKKHKKISTEKKDKEVLTKDDWDIICKEAVRKAKRGDAGARNWVSKYIYETGLPSAETENFKTDKSIILDVIDCLCGLGHKKKDIKDTVYKLAEEKEYKSVEEMIPDIYRIYRDTK